MKNDLKDPKSEYRKTCEKWTYIGLLMICSWEITNWLSELGPDYGLDTTMETKRRIEEIGLIFKINCMHLTMRMTIHNSGLCLSSFHLFFMVALL